MKLNSIFIGCLILCIAGCGSPEPDQAQPSAILEKTHTQAVDNSPKGPKAARKAAKPELLKLVRFFSKELRKSGPLELPDNLDLFVEFTDNLEPKQVLKELSKDPKALENLIIIKNLLLELKPEKPGLEPQKLTTTINKLLENESAIPLIIEIRNDLYNDAGKILRAIMQEASEDNNKKVIFMQAQAANRWKLELGTLRTVSRWPLNSLFAWADCPENIFFNKLLVFQKTSLNTNIAKLETALKQTNDLDDSELTWALIGLLPLVDYKSLERTHQWIQKLDAEKLRAILLIAFKHLNDNDSEEKPDTLVSNLISELFEYYTDIPLQSLNAKQLGELL